MTGASGGVLALLVLWGTVVALDLVSVPQALLSRPLVVGTVAGALLGDLETGLRVGVLFELFALDVLPVGAVQYPDYGPATIAAVAVATGAPWETSLGLAGVAGLLLAELGRHSLRWLRRANAHAIQASAAALAAGQTGAIRRLHYGSLARDAARGAVLTALGLAGAWAIATWVTLDWGTAMGLTLVVLGAGLSAVVSGALRSAGRGGRLRWLVAGGATGLLVAGLT